MKLVGMLSRFQPVRVLLVGDFMLDRYTTGKIRRISPEAPVSILHVTNEESRPGGAGNVALNLISLGATVVALGRVGNDRVGEALLHALDREGVDTQGIVVEEGFQTPVKNRLIADAQQILRVDTETISSPPSELEKVVIEKLATLLDSIKIVAISDYGKGFLTPYILTSVIKMAKERSIPVIVDPKGNDFSRYKGATVIKPNLTEAYAAAKLPSMASLDEVSAAIFQHCNVDKLLITRSEAGMSLFDKKGGRVDFPVRSKEVKDVTGAGDTVLAMISAALANGLDIKHGAQLANIAAGMAIERIGCARVQFSEMAERLLELDVDNKIFDEEHLYALQQALQGKTYTVLGLESSHGMSTAVFRSIRKLASRNKEQKLILYVRDNNPDEEFISLLSSLAEVDFIILKCESLKQLCPIIHPINVYNIQGGKLISLLLPELLEV